LAGNTGQSANLKDGRFCKLTLKPAAQLIPSLLRYIVTFVTPENLAVNGFLWALLLVIQDILNMKTTFLDGINRE